MTKSLTLILALVVFEFSYAGTSSTQTTIKEIAINQEYGNFAFIKLESPPTRSNCSINGYWDYTINLTDDIGKTQYSTVLAAYMGGKKVSMTGVSDGSCNEFGSVESMNTITTH